MKTIEIEGTLRKDLGKKATKALRREENVPCIIYGGKENVNFYAPIKSFKNLVYTPHVYLANLKVGNKTYLSMMKEIQFHPVTDELLHIDFIEVALDKEVIIDIPVKVVGSSIGVKKGGKVRLNKRLVKVKALPKNLPDLLEVDITELEIGQSVRVGDIKQDNIILLNKSHESVVSVMTSRVAAKEEEGSAATAEGAAPAEGAAAAPAAPAAEKKK